MRNKTNFVVKDEDLEKLEDDVREELAAIIGDYANDERLNHT